MRVLSGLYDACFNPCPDAKKNRKPESAVKITTEFIRNGMGLSTKKDEEYYSSRKVGRILDKYSIPKRKSGAMLYLDDKTKVWTYQDQKDYITDFLKRFNIDTKDLGEAVMNNAEERVERIDTSGYRFEEE